MQIPEEVTTTCGETFSGHDTLELAWLIYRRFGRNCAATTLAWNRLLQTKITKNDFEELILTREEIHKKDTSVTWW